MPSTVNLMRQRVAPNAARSVASKLARIASEASSRPTKYARPARPNCNGLSLPPIGAKAARNGSVAAAATTPSCRASDSAGAARPNAALKASQSAAAAPSAVRAMRSRMTALSTSATVVALAVAPCATAKPKSAAAKSRFGKDAPPRARTTTLAARQRPAATMLASALIVNRSIENADPATGAPPTPSSPRRRRRTKR